MSTHCPVDSQLLTAPFPVHTHPHISTAPIPRLTPRGPNAKLANFVTQSRNSGSHSSKASSIPVDPYVSRVGENGERIQGKAFYTGTVEGYNVMGVASRSVGVSAHSMAPNTGHRMDPNTVDAAGVCSSSVNTGHVPPSVRQDTPPTLGARWVSSAPLGGDASIKSTASGEENPPESLDVPFSRMNLSRDQAHVWEQTLWNEERVVIVPREQQQRQSIFVAKTGGWERHTRTTGGCMTEIAAHPPSISTDTPVLQTIDLNGVDKRTGASTDTLLSARRKSSPGCPLLPAYQAPAFPCARFAGFLCNPTLFAPPDVLASLRGYGSIHDDDPPRSGTFKARPISPMPAL
jgi:hypothetical protein